MVSERRFIATRTTKGRMRGRKDRYRYVGLRASGISKRDNRRTEADNRTNRVLAFV